MDSEISGGPRYFYIGKEELWAWTPGANSENMHSEKIPEELHKRLQIACAEFDNVQDDIRTYLMERDGE